MVHDKKRSGDPDYDDKVPMSEQVGERVTGPDGQEVIVTETIGPVNLDGSHADLNSPRDDRDNRPAPGGVATESSTVQIYDGQDVKEATRKSRLTDRSDK